MPLSNDQLLLSYKILNKVFPEDLHIARPLIQMLLDRRQKERARDLALATARRLLAMGDAGRTIPFLAMCRQLEHPKKDEIDALFHMARIASHSSTPTETTQGQTFALIEQLSDTEGLDFLQQGKLKHIAQGETIVRQGESSQTFYLILEGNVDVCITVEGGHCDTLTTLAPGHFFGELACVYRQPRSATVIARENILLLEFSEHFISRLMQHSQLAGEYMMKTVQSRMLHAMTHKHPAFAGLPEADRLWLAEESTIREYRGGEWVQPSETASAACQVILLGGLEAVSDRDETEWKLATGEMFGSPGPRISLPANTRLRAKEYTLIALIPETIFHSFMNAYASFEAFVQRQEKKYGHADSGPLEASSPELAVPGETLTLPAGKRGFSGVADKPAAS